MSTLVGSQKKEKLKTSQEFYSIANYKITRKSHDRVYNTIRYLAIMSIYR